MDFSIVIRSENKNSISDLLSTSEKNELLRFILERDNLTLDGVAKEYMAKRKEKILANHPYAISEGSDGRFRTYIKDESMKSGRRMIVKSSREKLEDELVEYYSSTLGENRSLTDLFPEFIEYKALHVEVTTIDRVRKDWKRYYEGSDIAQKPIREITKLDLDQFVHRTIKKFNMDRHQYGNFSLILRQELNYAVDLGIIDDNPFSHVTVIKQRVLREEKKKPDETQVFGSEELDRIYEQASEDFRRSRRTKHKLAPLGVMFLFQTGLRLGEVSALKFDDVKDDEVIVRRTVQWPRGDILDSTKGTYGDRTVPLTPKAKALINIAKHVHEERSDIDAEYIFVTAGEPIHVYQAIQRAFLQYCRALDICERGPHKARKTYISQLLDAGVNINTVRSVAGHKDEKTTLNNYCYDRKVKAARNAQVIAAIQ